MSPFFSRKPPPEPPAQPQTEDNARVVTAMERSGSAFALIAPGGIDGATSAVENAFGCALAPEEGSPLLWHGIARPEYGDPFPMRSIKLSDGQTSMVIFFAGQGTEMTLIAHLITGRPNGDMAKATGGAVVGVSHGQTLDLTQLSKGPGALTGTPFGSDRFGRLAATLPVVTHDQ